MSTSRQDEYNKGTVKRPCNKYLEWNSTDKCFTYYDKEQGKEVKEELPLKFIKLKELSTIKGWHNESNSGIWSNEVENVSTRPLHVRSFKGGDIVKGLYSDIKPEIEKEGGYFVKSIYGVDGTGEIINIQLKKSALGAYSSFIKEEGDKRSLTEWIVIPEHEDRRNGAISYSIPKFEYLKELTKDEIGEADDKYRELMEYFNAYTNNNETENVND